MPVNLSQLSDVKWVQPHAFSRSFELQAGGDVVATLEFRKMFGSLAVGRTSDGAWTLKRRGYFNTTVSVRVEGSEQDIAIYEPNWAGTKGAVVLSNGERLPFQTTNFWGTERVLTDATGEALVRFHNKGVFHHGAEVEVTTAGAKRENIGMLLILCWYVLVLYMEDSSAATVVMAG